MSVTLLSLVDFAVRFRFNTLIIVIIITELPVLLQYPDNEGSDQNSQLPTSDLTLYIGLAVAFLVFVLVIFIIIRLLRRKRSPHTGYSLTSTGDYS